MRQIKIRAWLKAESKMCDVYLLRFDAGAFLIGAEPGADIISSDGKLCAKAPDNGRFCNNGEFELMQFTGLLDKNGKEIYESDVLNKKTTFENNMADKRFQPATQINVGFENGSFIDKNTGKVLFEAMIIVSSFPQKSWTNYEIIGNEYENTELK